MLQLQSLLIGTVRSEPHQNTIAEIPGTMDFNGFMQAAGAFLTAFSQGRHVIKSQLAEGNSVSICMEWHAVHTSPFNGIPPSNKPVKIQAITNHRISNGKITEHIAMFDAISRPYVSNTPSGRWI